MKTLLLSLLFFFTLTASAYPQQPAWMQYGSSYDATLSKPLEFKDWFGMELFVLYMFAADTEMENGDYLDADFYVLKANAAAKGDYVPDSQVHYNLSAKDRGTFDSARKRLVAILPVAKEFATEDAAKAQYLYQCALKEAEEGPRSCEEGFWDVLGKLEYQFLK